MVKITNIFGDKYSGQAGKAGVFASWKGRQYRRSYVIPSNPKTAKQTTVRDNLANAISRWHQYITVQRQAYSYMAAGLVMSGFNLFVSRWQKAMPNSATQLIAPPIGIKCIGNTETAREETDPAPTLHSFSLGNKPVTIGSLTFTKASTDKVQDAYAEIQQGFVRLPLQIAKTDGAAGLGETLADGDKLLISYTSSGRVVTRELLEIVTGGAGHFTAKATMALALRTKYSPIDYGSVVIEIEDVSPTPHTWTQLESIEIDPILGKIYYDKTDAAQAASAVNYNSYTPVENVKLEATKSDTSFIAERAYSDENGQIPVAFTEEDETFDLVFSLTGYTSVLATAKTALLAAVSEFVDIGESS